MHLFNVCHGWVISSAQVKLKYIWTIIVKNNRQVLTLMLQKNPMDVPDNFDLFSIYNFGIDESHLKQMELYMPSKEKWRKPPYHDLIKLLTNLMSLGNFFS